MVIDVVHVPLYLSMFLGIFKKGQEMYGLPQRTRVNWSSCSSDILGSIIFSNRVVITT